MSPAEMSAIGAALATVIIAALAYMAAWLQAHTNAIAANRAAITAMTRAVGSRVEGGAPNGAGAGAIRAAPVWNQLQDPGSQGDLPPRGPTDCGEECCAETIYRQHGVEVQADYLRFQLRGASATGVTTAPDLVRLLARNNVSAAAESVPADQVAARLQAVVKTGGQAIALGRWVSPTVLHWVLVTSADTETAGANDPWGGLRRRWAWSDFVGDYAGSLVVVTRKPDTL